MVFKDIPAGSFYMGSCKPDKKREFMGLPPDCPSGAGANDAAQDSEIPQHEVRIKRGFRMGVYEVTLGQFKQFIAGAGRDDLLTDDFIEDNSGDDRAPVTHVSWHDAQDFIRWLNEKEGTRAYRLPTEAEWEYAARAGTTTRYSWGDSINCSQGRYGRRPAISEHSIPVGECSDSFDGAVTVGSFAANAFGLYDMHGNVWEWVEDCWHHNYEGAPSDGSAWTTGCDYKSRAVVRGGSFNNDPKALHSESRGRNKLSRGHNSVGFRLVQDLNS